jgi:sterol desaturase/sphingolipid hydroxylase (fatty acid hydroxylase superfamily)
MEPRFVTPTDTKGWLLDKFAMGTANYWFAFIADFATAMFFLTWEIGFQGRHAGSACMAFLAGYLAWTLTEYVFHRWVYHQANGIFGAGHNIHHTEAQVLIAMPWFMTTLTMFGLWQIFSRYLSVPYFSSILAGWLVGFVWYSLVHHSHHHWKIQNGWLRRLKAYHRVHHNFPESNFGVTLRFWDVVFNTTYRKPVPLSESSLAGKHALGQPISAHAAHMADA